MPRPILAPGARVAIVAPAHPFAEDGVQAGQARLRDWGFEPVEAPNLRARHRYTAGTVGQRVADLQWALSSPDVDAVWFARGGSGTGRLLDALDWDAVAEDRPVLGFSDATALFCGMWRHRRGRAVHAPVLHSLTRLPDDDSVAALQAVLDGGPVAMGGRQLSGPPGALDAPLVGGNLCVLASLCGTPWQLDARGCALLLEDIGEPPYKVDRLLFQLEAAGALDGVAAVLFGELTGCAPPADADPPWSLDDLMLELTARLDVPVWADVPVGHGTANRPFVWGSRVRVEAGGLHVC